MADEKSAEAEQAEIYAEVAKREDNDCRDLDTDEAEE